ncbi:V-type ATP synthase subunit E [Saccharicrinis aurantiacus]|uniref:V-type ATP synthase subunit E n=1 Tax=Saccharicrinis aurantiacus TaxID=1849719 RepID=UPI002491094D|nr:V-type ATP synthase subunit E [Saccharicrinis aurantiacus]
MQSKLQELTDKLYAEGVQKAQSEAEAILAKAKADAEKVLAEANKKAEEVVSEANTKAAEITKNVASELKMSSQQAISSLRQQIETSITLKVAEPSVKEVFGNAEYLKEIIVKVVEGWTKSGNFDINLALAEADKTEMDKYISNSLSKELNAGLSFEFNKGIKAGFKVGPKDGSYVISFTEGDFQNFFKGFLRPKTNQLLFEE